MTLPFHAVSTKNILWVFLQAWRDDYSSPKQGKSETIALTPHFLGLVNPMIHDHIHVSQKRGAPEP